MRYIKTTGTLNFQIKYIVEYALLFLLVQEVWNSAGNTDVIVQNNVTRFYGSQCVYMYQVLRRTRRRQRTFRHSSKQRTRVQRKRSTVIRHAPLTPPTFSSSLMLSLTSSLPTTCAAVASTDLRHAQTHIHLDTRTRAERQTRDRPRHVWRDVRLSVLSCPLCMSSFVDQTTSQCRPMTS